MLPAALIRALHSAHPLHHPQKHLLVMGKSMNFIDLAGAELREAELAARRAMGGYLYFHRPCPEVIAMRKKTGFTRARGGIQAVNCRF